LFITIDTVWNEDPDHITNTVQILKLSSYINMSLVFHRLANAVKQIRRSLVELNKIKPNQFIVKKHQKFLSKLKEAQLAYVPQKHTGRIISFLSQEYLQKYGSTGLNNYLTNKAEHKEYIIHGFHDSLFEDAYLNDLGEILKVRLK